MSIAKIAFLSSLVLTTAGAAVAQTLEERNDLDRAPRALQVSPEETVLIERYVREEPEVPIIEEHMTLRPGSIIPEGVPLRVFSKNTELARFAYFISVDDKVVIADPRTRTVVRILDKKS